MFSIFFSDSSRSRWIHELRGFGTYGQACDFLARGYDEATGEGDSYSSPGGQAVIRRTGLFGIDPKGSIIKRLRRV